MYLRTFADNKNILINKEPLYYNKVVFFSCYEQSFKIIDNTIQWTTLFMKLFVQRHRVYINIW